MSFEDLQRFFAGGFTEKEEAHLFALYQTSEGMNILSMAIKEGWDEAADKKGPVWNPDLCFIKLLNKINLIEP